MASLGQNFEPVITYNQPSYVVIQLMEQAYRMAGALKHPGQHISVPSETDEGLLIANAMIDGWKTENLLVIYTRRTIQQMLSGQDSYSVGPQQDFDIERPEHIHRAGFIVGTLPTDAEVPMSPILTYEEWASFVTKHVGSSNPLAFYYQAAVPYGAFRVWPVPNQDSLIAIYTPQYLSEFSTVDDNAIFPDGFREMFMYNLAVAVHERYPDRAMDSSVAVKAVEYKNRIKANLLTGLFIGSDRAVMQESFTQRYVGGQPRNWLPPWY